MTTALENSFTVLLWNLIIFLLALTFFALIICQSLSDMYFQDPTRPLEQRQELWIYFGTFSRSLFTMFELTFANWPPVARLLVEHVHSVFMWLMVLYKLTFGFAVVAVVNAVFMQ